MIIQRLFSSIPTYTETKKDFFTAMHEAGHFIFFIRGLKKLYGKLKASLMIPELNLSIEMERRDNPNALSEERRRKAHFCRPESMLWGRNDTHYDEGFLISAGGLAVDSITNRAFSGLAPDYNNLMKPRLVKNQPVISLVQEELLFIEKWLKRGITFELLGKYVLGDSKGMLRCLLGSKKYKGAEDTLDKIKSLGKSITSKEWKAILEIADSIYTTLLTLTYVNFDLTIYALELLKL